MNEYKKPYTIMFNAVTDAIRKIVKGDNAGALEILVEAQQKAEEEFISFEE